MLLEKNQDNVRELTILSNLFNKCIIYEASTPLNIRQSMKMGNFQSPGSELNILYRDVRIIWSVNFFMSVSKQSKG